MDSLGFLATVPPVSADPVEMRRVEHSRQRRRMLYGQHEADLDRLLRQSVGNVRGEAWKPIDLSANPYLSIWSQLAVLYSVSPEVAAAAPEVADALRLGGYWQLMQRVQRDTLAIREMLIRMDSTIDGRIVARPVFPDMVEASSFASDPSAPVVVREWIHDPARGWLRHITDIRDPGMPLYQVITSRGEDITAEVLGADY